MIRVESMSKKYTAVSGDILAVDNISVSFGCNGLYMILGKSGCGKTTFLNILSGLDSCDMGHVYIDDLDMNNCSSKELDEYRNLRLGIVFQEYNLISELTVYDNLRLVLEIQDWPDKDEYTVRSRINSILTKVGLQGYESRKIYELSGGEMQRVAIARTLIKCPNIILADEPTGNLDIRNGEAIFEILNEISKDYIVIVVTHDREAAFRYGDTIIEMENGRILDIIHTKKDEDIKVYTLECQINERQIQNKTLEHTSVLEFVSSLLAEMKANDTVALNIIDKSSCEYNPHNNQGTENCVKISKFTKRLPTRYKFQLATCFITKKKLTLFFSICILAISLSMFFGALTTSFYQRDKTMLVYFEEYEPELIPIYTSVSYQDSFYQTHTETLTKGKYLTERLDTLLNKEAIKLEIVYDTDFFKIDFDEMTNNSASSVSMIFFPDEYNNLLLAKGHYPVSENECLITDYLAVVLGVGVGDRITNLYQEFRISGIVQTDYIQYQLKEKLIRGNNSIYVDYYMKHKYNVVYCKSRLLHDGLQNSNTRLMLPMSNFMLSDREISYRESSLRYDNAQKVTAFDLVVGRMPQTDNEILVSDSFCINNNIFKYADEFEEFHSSYANIYAEKYNSCYSEYLNLSEFFPNGIEIVGVVTNLGNDKLDSDVYVMPEKWLEITNCYYDYYAASILYSVDRERYSSFIHKLSEISVRMDEPSLAQIYDFSDTLIKMRPFLVALLVTTIFLSGFILTNFIHVSIRSNKKSIGILRSIGISMKDVSRLFTLETWGAYALSVLLMLPIVFSMQCIANNIYMKNVFENPYRIITWNWTACITVLLSVSLLCLLALCIQKRKLKQLKLIDLIR